MSTRTSRSASWIVIVCLLGAEAASAQTKTALAENKLGNAGIETWSHGAVDMGPIGPDLWFAQGVPSLVQSDILFTRAPEFPDQGSGPPYVAEITATTPGRFISQRMETALEYRGNQVTFGVDFRTCFSVAQPRIAIFDGVTQTNATQLINGGCVESVPPWTRLIVHHLVSPNATTLEFRIYPDQTVQVNDAVALIGNIALPSYSPRRNPEPGLSELPLGAVIDWWRANVNVPVPEGFVIMDGSPISDPHSPFVGLSTLNLTNQFVRGVSDPNRIGESGGAAARNLAHTHTGRTRGDDNSNCNNPNFDYQFFPCCSYVPSACGHTHDFTTNSSLGTVSIEPPYVGLLKIMRIK